jgi:hypothetical protein
LTANEAGIRSTLASCGKINTGTKRYSVKISTIDKEVGRHAHMTQFMLRVNSELKQMRRLRSALPVNKTLFLNKRRLYERDEKLWP